LSLASLFTSINRVRFAVLVLLFSCTVVAQEKDFTPPAVTPEGQFLELIDLEGDAQKQLVLMDLFVKQFPAYNAMAAVYSEMQANCVKLNLFDRALEIGEKLLAIDQDDAEALKLNLEAARGKQDQALIKKWGDRLAQLNQSESTGAITATSTINLPFAEGPDGAAEVPGVPGAPGTVSRMVKARMEASLFNKAIAENNPTVRLDTLDQFLKQFPQSAHISKVNYLRYQAYRDLKDNKNALTVAEQIVAKDQSREDLLYFVAETYFAQKRELAKVLILSRAMLDVVTTKPKPQNLSESEWAKQKATITLQAHYMMGTTFAYQEQFAQADKNLRLALADGGMSEATRAGILTSIAWANYKIKNIPEAIKFYEQCASIPGPLQTPATQSAASIRNEYGLAQ
jgi:tetratricopeptide (TPR) repeat protein